MKRSQLILVTLILPIDYVLLVGAAFLAYELRFVGLIRDIRPVQFEFSRTEFLPTALVVALAWVLILALSGLYVTRNYLKLSQELARIFLACSAGLGLIIVVFFFDPHFFNSRFIVLAGWGLAVFLVSAAHIGIRLLRRLLYARGVGISRAILLGNDITTHILYEFFQTHPELGVKIVQVFPNFDSQTLALWAPRVDEFFIGDPHMPHNNIETALEIAETNHIGFKYAADMFETHAQNVITHTLAGVPIIELRRTPLEGWGRIAKRVFDIICAIGLLVFCLPFFVLIISIILWNTGWPVLVALKRVGQGGSVFLLYKFRSMVVGAHLKKSGLVQLNERNDGPLFKIKNDPRVTKVGKWLRQLSLDELPQLWNVIRGDMSLVGPRPHEPEEVAQYATTQRKLLQIRPGMTGLAQISGRSDLRFEEEVRLDTYYIENWSLFTDILIMIKTALVILRRGAS